MLSDAYFACAARPSKYILDQKLNLYSYMVSFQVLITHVYEGTQDCCRDKFIAPMYE